MMQSYGWNLQQLQHSQIIRICVTCALVYFGMHIFTDKWKGKISHVLWKFLLSQVPVTASQSFRTFQAWVLDLSLKSQLIWVHTHTHTHPFNGPFSGTTQVSLYRKGKTNLDFTEARDSEWQWHQLGRMQVCSRQITTPPPTQFLQAGCPSCCPTNSVKALKALKLIRALV